MNLQNAYRMEKKMYTESRKERAVAYFKAGHNCSQSVFAVFADKYGMDEETALKVSASFGGGIGRMREVCGTVCGMSMVAGMETGATDGSLEGKKHNYEVVQRLAGIFRERNGSIICRELLGLVPKEEQGRTAKVMYTDTTPEARTEQYYKKRPCIKLIAEAVEILEQELFHEEKEEPVGDKPS